MDWSVEFKRFELAAVFSSETVHQKWIEKRERDAGRQAGRQTRTLYDFS